MGSKTYVNHHVYRKEQNHETQETEIVTSRRVLGNHHLCSNSVCQQGDSVQAVAAFWDYRETRCGSAHWQCHPEQGPLWRGRDRNPFPHHDC